MKTPIHYFFIRSIRGFVKSHEHDAPLAGICEEGDEECATWRIPALRLRIAVDPDRLIVSLMNGKPQTYLWRDLLQGQPVRPSMQTIHEGMYSKQFEIISTSFGNDVGAWRHIELPGFIMISVWDSLLECNAKRNRNDRPPYPDQVV
jgi:hypothetical protein